MRLQRLVHDLHPSEPQAKMRPPQLESARTKAPSLGPVNSVEPPAPIRYWDENKDGTASTRLVVVMSEDWQEEERGGLSDHGCRLGLAPVGTSSTCRRSDLSADIRRMWSLGALERLGDPYIEDGILELNHVWANSPLALASESPPPVRLPDLSTA